MRIAVLIVCALWSLIGFAGEVDVAVQPTPSKDASVSVDLSGPWIVRVENPQHRVMTTLTVLFTSEKAVSCLGGDWKKVSVLAFDSSDKEFFPSGELSYQVRGGNIAIGRNSVCDAYLHLVGEMGAGPVKGEYIRFGWGVSPLGYFTLTKGS